MRGIAVAYLYLAFAGATAFGQVKNTEEGEAIIGLVGQNDARKVDGVQLSPVGLTLGVIVQPIFSNRRLSIVEQISFFPTVRLEQQASLSGAPIAGRPKPLIINNLWARLSTHEPETTGESIYFAGVGLILALSTPRDGPKAAPMVGIGMRRWLVRQVGFEVSLQCGARQIGRTVCVLPVTSAWPFH